MLPRLALSPAFRASLTRARPSRPFRAAKLPPRFAVQISNRDHPILHLFLRQPPLLPVSSRTSRHGMRRSSLL